MLETSRQRLREAALANRRLRPLDGVRNTAKDCPSVVEIKHEVRGARVAVARLADRPGIDEPALARLKIQFRSSRGKPAVEPAARERERERDVAVADENERLARRGEGCERDLGREDVLPHRVARARVVEPDGAAPRRRLERLEVLPGLVRQDGTGPARADRGVVRELLEVEAPEHAKIVVPDQAELGSRRHERAAGVRLGPVPYEVPEAPERVGGVFVQRGEDGFERMHIPVNVRDHADAHRATLAKRLGAVAVAAAWVGTAVLLWRTKVPPLDLPEVDAREHFPAAELERSAEFRTVTRSLWVGATAIELGTLAVIAWKGRPLARLVATVAHGRVRTAVGVGLVVVLAVWLTAVPLGAASHWWRRKYGLSEQGYGGWLRDVATSLGIRAVLVSLAVAGTVVLARRLGRRWWLAGGPALVVVGVVLVLAQPIVIQPLFNRFAPLPDRRLAADVESLAARMGVRIDTVQVADASRRTTTPNAYVAGIGPTKRVVFYDTILDGRFSHGELVSVAAHELAHVERRHMWKGLAWFTLLALPGVYVVARVTERRGGIAEPAVIPLGLLVAVALSLATLPLQNAVSRRYEAEADWLALTATRDPEGAVALDRRLVTTSLGDPHPPAWAKIVLSTHPSAVERIAMAKAFEGLEAERRSRL